MSAEERPQLKVIEGGRKPLPTWMQFPPTVAAACPTDSSRVVVFRVAVGDAIKAWREKKRRIFYDLWCGVFGEPPPVPCVETYNDAPREGLLCLTQAHACFKGIKRPLDTDNNGGTVLAYVLRPRCHYAWQLNMACQAKKQKVPRDVVFVVYVRLDEPFELDSGRATGIVTHWQFVEASPIKAGDGRTEMLPVDFSDRYGERLW